MADRGRAPQRDAGSASAEVGLVMLDGPDGVAIAMTPDAAEATGYSLIAAAKEARGQPPEPMPKPR